jgi:hypothetical protein
LRHGRGGMAQIVPSLWVHLNEHQMHRLNGLNCVQNVVMLNKISQNRSRASPREWYFLYSESHASTGLWLCPSPREVRNGYVCVAQKGIVPKIQQTTGAVMPKSQMHLRCMTMNSDTMRIRTWG